MTARTNQLTTLTLAALVLTGLAWFAFGATTATEQTEQDADADRLAVVWTSGDPDVAHRMALMYTNGAQRQNWFDEVRLVIWGPSQRLLIGDKDLQAEIAKMQEAGVHVQACVVCARSYGLVDDLKSLDIEVKAMGQPLSEYLKDPDRHVLTF